MVSATQSGNKDISLLPKISAGTIREHTCVSSLLSSWWESFREHGPGRLAWRLVDSPLTFLHAPVPSSRSVQHHASVLHVVSLLFDSNLRPHKLGTSSFPPLAHP